MKTGRPQAHPAQAAFRIFQKEASTCPKPPTPPKNSSTEPSTLPELDPATELEFHFATLYARTSVLLEMAQKQVLAVNPHAGDTERKLYFRLLNQVATQERALRHALNELRRLQTERALRSVAENTEFKPTLLARLALYTKPDGAPRKVTENIPSMPCVHSAPARAA